jgi:hypothetical protein
MGFSLVFPSGGSSFFIGYFDGSCWERDRHSETRERQRRRPTELLAMGHSVLAMGLAVTHGHPLWLTFFGADSHIVQY